MSIADKSRLASSVTDGGEALRFFVDRRHAIQLFCSYVHQDQPPEKVLFFHGEGGTGKTLLLRFLREKCCKSVSPRSWKAVQGMNAEDIITYFVHAPSQRLHPTAALDFGSQPSGNDRPQEAVSALLMLRRTLGGRSLHFPVFDFACLWYFHQTNQLHRERIQSLFPAAEVDFVAAVADALTHNAYGAVAKAVLTLADAHAGEKLALYRQKRKLDEDTIRSIQAMDPYGELLDRLPVLFAEDLNTSIRLKGAPRRVVLLFDTHEALWGQLRSQSDAQFFKRDEWLRCLLGKLELGSGIVAAVAGRDLPRWAHASQFDIPGEYVELCDITGLAPPDATRYLEAIGIADAKLRRKLLAHASDGAGVHPLYLGLCADIVREAESRRVRVAVADLTMLEGIANRRLVLIERLLRWVDDEIEDAVYALSACRAFDRRTFFVLGDRLRFLATGATFDRLLQFSFVWRIAGEGEPRYRIHDLLRRLLLERNSELVRRAHQVLAEHYGALAAGGSGAEAAEAVYHRHQLEPEAGLRAWLEAFEDALRVGRYDLCRTLLALLSEMSVPSPYWHAALDLAEGDYHVRVSAYDLAAQEYSSAIGHLTFEPAAEPLGSEWLTRRSAAYTRLGRLHAVLSEHDVALSRYADALRDLRNVLALLPDDPEANQNLATTLWRRGESQLHTGDAAAALASFEEAIACFDNLLLLGADGPEALKQKGTVLHQLGTMEADTGRDRAVEHLNGALRAFDLAIEQDPGYLEAYNNKGLALGTLAEHFEGRGEAGRARDCHGRAVQCFEAALRIAPRHAEVLNNAGLAHSSFGRFLARTDTSAGLRQYDHALKRFDNALEIAPAHVYMHANRGNLLAFMAHALYGEKQYARASSALDDALASYDTALARASGYAYAHNGRGWACYLGAKVAEATGDPSRAAEHYAAAIRSYDAALRVSPGFVAALNNRAMAAAGLGDLLFGLDRNAAVERLQEAVGTYTRAREVAPDHVQIRRNLGETLLRLAQKLARMGRSAQARSAVEAAMDEFRGVLEELPGDEAAPTLARQAEELLEEIARRDPPPAAGAGPRS